MTTDSQAILVIAPPGRLRDSLLVLLQASGQVSLAGQADDGPAGLCWLAERIPIAVLLDADLPDGQAWWALRWIKNKWPQLPCLVLAHTHAQECQARVDGAEVVVQVGLSSETLFNALDELAHISSSASLEHEP